MQNSFFIKILSLIAIPYSTFVALLYLYGFWGTFDLNILEYVNLSGLVVQVIYPLAGSFFLFLISFAISRLLLPPSLPPGGGQDTKVGQFGRNHWQIFIAILIIILVGVILFIDNPAKWFGVTFLIALTSVIFTHANFFIDLIPDPKARATILFLLFYIPGLSFAQGKYTASMILKGKAVYLADMQTSEIDDCETSCSFSYLGYIASNYVLYDNSQKRLIFVNGNLRELFVLKYNPNRN